MQQNFYSIPGLAPQNPYLIITRNFIDAIGGKNGIDCSLEKRVRAYTALPHNVSKPYIILNSIQLEKLNYSVVLGYECTVTLQIYSEAQSSFACYSILAAVSQAIASNTMSSDEWMFSKINEVNSQVIKNSSVKSEQLIIWLGEMTFKCYIIGLPGLQNSQGGYESN